MAEERLRTPSIEFAVAMKQIQEWLGHSDFATTANIYAHLEYSSKRTSADAMLSGLGLAQEGGAPLKNTGNML